MAGEWPDASVLYHNDSVHGVGTRVLGARGEAEDDRETA